ncbi:MAG: hypothetical protein ACEQSR_13795 [Candidatus Methylacidiphilales bacterium]
MKQKINTIAILLFLSALIACNSNSSENKNSEKNALQNSSNDSTIVIAELNGGVPSFVADSNTLRNDWQKFISNQAELGSCQLNKIEILAGVDSSGANKYYLIVSGTINNENMKSTILLEQGGSNCLVVMGYTLSCTTKACAEEDLGCVPKVTSCSPCNNKGACTKTITNSPTAIFPSVEPSTCQN